MPSIEVSGTIVLGNLTVLAISLSIMHYLIVPCLNTFQLNRMVKLWHIEQAVYKMLQRGANKEKNLRTDEAKYSKLHKYITLMS